MESLHKSRNVWQSPGSDEQAAFGVLRIPSPVPDHMVESVTKGPSFFKMILVYGGERGLDEVSTWVFCFMNKNMFKNMTGDVSLRNDTMIWNNSHLWSPVLYFERALNFVKLKYITKLETLSKLTSHNLDGH